MLKISRLEPGGPWFTVPDDGTKKRRVAQALRPQQTDDAVSPMIALRCLAVHRFCRRRPPADEVCCGSSKWQVLSAVRRPGAANTVCPPVGAAIRVDLRGNPIEAVQGPEEDQAPGCEVEMIGVKAPQEEDNTYVPSWRPRCVAS